MSNNNKTIHLFMLAETLNLMFEDESEDEDDVITHESKTTYKGVHINFPLNKNDIDTLIDSFRRKKV